VCGDDIEVFLIIEGTEKSKQWSFTGQASMITIACSGLFGDIVQGIDFETLFSWNQETIIRDTGITVSPRRSSGPGFGTCWPRETPFMSTLKDGKKDDFSDVLSDL
jgi:hypothetical protein